MSTRIRKRLIKLWHGQIHLGDEFEQYWQWIDQVRGWLSKEEGYTLFKLARGMRPNLAFVEIGSYEGRSTVCIAFGLKGGKLIAIDPHTGDITEKKKGLTKSTLPALRENLQRAGLADKVELIVSPSDIAVRQLSGIRIGGLFIDGWHSADQVERDIRNFMVLADKKCIVVIDDYANDSVSLGIANCRDVLPSRSGQLGKIQVFGLPMFSHRLFKVLCLIYLESVRTKLLKRWRL
jgi:hypothetical protein